MTKRRLSSEMREKIKKFHEESEYGSLTDTRNRARSITVGTNFGGIVEIMLRSDSGYMYALLQPVEAVEIIEQLAAGCGIEIAMRPKQNFTSWRGWDIGDCENVYIKGSAPWQIEGHEHTKKLQAIQEEAELELRREEVRLEKEKRIKKLHATKNEESEQ